MEYVIYRGPDGSILIEWDGIVWNLKAPLMDSCIYSCLSHDTVALFSPLILALAYITSLLHYPGLRNP